MWARHRMKSSSTSVYLYYVIILLGGCAVHDVSADITIDDFERVLDDERTWPYTTVYECDEVNTRHDQEELMSESLENDNDDLELTNDEYCGLNQYSTENTDKKLRKRNFYSRISKTAKKFRRLISNKLGTPTAKIVGGKKSVEGKWPWLACIGRYKDGPLCGGALISDQWVITAAHCIDDTEKPCEFNVRLGTTQCYFDTEETHIDIMVEDIFKHPDHDLDAHVNDIALLKLSRKVDFSENQNVRSICLPNHEKSVEVNSHVWAAGWGTRKQDGEQSNDLYEVKLRVISYTGYCAENENIMAPGTVCAGYVSGGKDTCQGDSGGPIAYERDGRWHVLGVTSWGYGCAKEGHPGYYTDVGDFREWIENVLHIYT